ncbi:MarR family winged helix-turn-helix transcriptional regulator [Mycetocola zhujimingii]|uniref:MarR family winged helix-turn-helix transcriptional regulator n=1 Tax=Mycetocola zhujimingii TaxID=2079792 RepID=UPI000D3C0BF2|nr:MarR family winged helix-turn-helix transcriptional regulator [Mycetocola zhujimingii]AWB85368.1 MarR family transcriptional regulator [Mycetocola zhujimingii]
MTDSLTGGTPEPGRHSAAIGAVEVSMGALSRRLQLVLKNAATAIDPSLPPAGFQLLRLIEHCGSVQAGVAAERLVVDRSVVSRHIRQLEELGLVETRTDPSDGRARFLVLTEEGVRRMRAVNPSGKSITHALLTEWEVDELEGFAAQLERLTAAIDHRNDEGPSTD